jgi:hypothetical protein
MIAPAAALAVQAAGSGKARPGDVVIGTLQGKLRDQGAFLGLD